MITDHAALVALKLAKTNRKLTQLKLKKNMVSVNLHLEISNSLHDNELLTKEKLVPTLLA
jgi:hypothetical protein